jgi:hypothetical protein
MRQRQISSPGTRKPVGKLKMNAKMYDALKDAALSGDADGYTFWNPKIKTGQSVPGWKF